MRSPKSSLVGRLLVLLRAARIELNARHIAILIVSATALAGLEIAGGLLLYSVLAGSAAKEETVPVLAALTTIVFAMRGALFVSHSRKLQGFIHGLGERLTTQLVSHYSREPYASYLKHDRAAMQQTATASTMQVAGNLIGPLLTIASDAMQVVAILIVLAFGALLPAVAAAAIIVPIFIVVARFALPRAGAAGVRAVEAGRDNFEAVGEVVQHMRELQLFGSEEAFVTKVADAAKRQAQAHQAKAVLADVPRIALEFAGILFLVAASAMVSIVAPSDAEVLGAAGLLGYGILRLMPVAGRTMASLAGIRFAHAALCVLEDEFTRPEAVVSRRIVVTSIRCDQLRIGYSAEQTVASGISFELRVGDSLAIVGESGAGKSTLLDTVLGLLPNLGGSILWDGRTVAGRVAAAVVSQSPVMFAGSVRQNVALGCSEYMPSDPEIWFALERAALHEFIFGLPDRLNTVLGYGGRGLSGGQRQRLAIARAIVQPSHVLVLDEGTSALDAVIACRVLDSLWEHFADGLILASSHDNEVIARCSRTIRLRDGQAEMGSQA